ncbi:kinase-like domain-containing protein [Tribonema minus]|uniref:Kinase-like domain-containing protein n=1 Tax=Tribonema minus TaxID=303371 RepID=A0A835YV80_9STRA|nr:kinase-like domain-containing protein [Tribonema minus]
MGSSGGGSGALATPRAQHGGGSGSAAASAPRFALSAIKEVPSPPPSTDSPASSFATSVTGGSSRRASNASNASNTSWATDAGGGGSSGGSGCGSAERGEGGDEREGAAAAAAAAGAAGGAHAAFRALLSADRVVEVNGKPYVCLACIGRGGSSKVYRVLSADRRVLALKRVAVGADDAAGLAGYANEIALLRRLRGDPAIIALEDAEVDAARGTIALVLELGEVDLSQVLARQRTAEPRSSGGGNGGYGEGLSPHFIRLTWLQMLRAVSALHAARVVHGDLKPANFVLCAGALKLIDFGIAKAIGNDTANISRESQVGTLNYMCPEAILDTGKGAIDPATGRKAALMKLGRPSDVWYVLGCILYQLVYGHTPFSHLRLVQKLQAITDPRHEIVYGAIDDASLLDTMQSCLRWDPQLRAPIDGRDGLLEHRYLHPATGVCI